MKTTIGGDRLGSGNKQEVSMRNFERSTHDLSYIWRSSMSAGTLVPFMSEVALPGDSFDIKLQAEVLTLPTVGPLFGSYKVQLDTFLVPMRLYNAGLHMNRLGIGMDMSSVYLPKIEVLANNHVDKVYTYDDNEQISSSCSLKYLGIGGVGRLPENGILNPMPRKFNAVPYLGYWDIYKNYYANKQEERGFAIHIDDANKPSNAITRAQWYNTRRTYNDIYVTGVTFAPSINSRLYISFGNDAINPDPEDIVINFSSTAIQLSSLFNIVRWNNDTKQIECLEYIGATTSTLVTCNAQNVAQVEYGVNLVEFPLSNIDDMREDILQHPFASGEFVIDANSQFPYSMPMKSVDTGADLKYSCEYGQEGLALKTYQSDLFNNWISTEWIDGTNGINEVTAVDTTGDSFTIDALNLASKVYAMLNRIAISGGTYDDWLDAVYTHERSRSVENPIYMGSLIKELAFEEVVSTVENSASDIQQPLGTLAGRGRLTQKNKGGTIRIKVDEPSYIISIASLTPRVDYSQGTKWDCNLDTMNDLHKPSLGSIGYQDLITEQMVWSETLVTGAGVKTVKSAGKQPAWINYMTSVNKTFGSFAEVDKDMFMTLNRRYDKTNGEISDLTTYIDPSKFNFVFAQTSLDSQNFWTQISCKITARRKMSAKVIPNL